ncbi:MAG TPA: type VI secretion system tube protein Hcp [Planctomycetota bacterium]|nr:type VI secretion system tube protein Hcp [Planctomycetota bacterium]
MPLFMQIEGSESGLMSGGEGVLKEHKGWIPFDDFTFGSDAARKKALAKENKLVAAPPSGEEPPAEPDSLYGSSVTVNRKLDVVSPQLMKWLSSGEEATVDLHHCTMDGVVLFALKLFDARLKDYSASDQNTDGEIPETLTITWQAFEIETVEIGKKGEPLP